MIFMTEPTTKPPQVKIVQFTEEELKAFEVIFDSALKASGVKLAMQVAYFIQKFNSVPMTDCP